MSEQERRIEAQRQFGESAVRLAGAYYLQLSWYAGHWHSVVAITPDGFMLAPCQACMPMPADVEARLLASVGML